VRSFGWQVELLPHSRPGGNRGIGLETETPLVAGAVADGVKELEARRLIHDPACARHFNRVGATPMARFE
jgi:hypothetical protein